MRMIWSSRFCVQKLVNSRTSWVNVEYLEPLVLEDSLDGSILSRWRQLGLENNAEGAISDNLALRVLQVPSFSSHSILDLLADHLCNCVSSAANDQTGPKSSGPMAGLVY
jgi:hypothetical protein